jgi:hypothetical protein
MVEKDSIKTMEMKDIMMMDKMHKILMQVIQIIMKEVKMMVKMLTMIQLTL